MTTQPEIVDSHCHLDFDSFDGDRGDVISRALGAGVRRMLTICTDPDDVENAREIAESHDAVFYAAGVHPHRVGRERPVTAGELAELARHPKMAGIGETGLDYHYTKDLKREQAESLRVHIEAARQTGLPLIIHSRDADEDMARILSEEHAKGEYSCVMHCFSSGPELAKTALGLGFYLSMSGIVTFGSAGKLRETFAAAPVDRILVETDSPFLAPVPNRGSRNEPSYTVHTAKAGAELLGMDYADFARRTTENFNRLFPKAALAIG